MVNHTDTEDVEYNHKHAQDDAWLVNNVRDFEWYNNDEEERSLNEDDIPEEYDTVREQDFEHILEFDEFDEFDDKKEVLDALNEKLVEWSQED